MNSVLDTLQTWARKARAARRPVRATVPPFGGDPLAYRLRGWPELPSAQRTARVLGVMSTMSVRPVRRGWMLEQSKLPPAELDALIARLVREQLLEVIDTSAFLGREPAQAVVI